MGSLNLASFCIFMSKTFIGILLVIAAGVGFTMFGAYENKKSLQNYERALAECGLNQGGFSFEELDRAQECACKNGDKISCDFVNLQKATGKTN